MTSAKTGPLPKRQNRVKRKLQVLLTDENGSERTWDNSK